jgi:hypothetical protein
MLLECEAMVNAKEIANFVDEDTNLPWNIRYTFARCPVCSSALLARQVNMESDWDKPLRVFPAW